MKLDKFFEKLNEQNEKEIGSAIRDLSRHQLAAAAKLLGIHVQISEYNDAVEDIETALAELPPNKRNAIEDKIRKMSMRYQGAKD